MKEFCIPYRMLVETLEAFSAIRNAGKESTLEDDGFNSTVWIAISKTGHVKQVRIPLLPDNSPVPMIACGEYAVHLGISRKDFMQALVTCANAEVERLKAELAKQLASQGDDE